MPLPFVLLGFLSRSTANTQPETVNMNISSASIADLFNLNQHVDTDEDTSGSEIDTISKRLSELQDELLTSLKEDISEWIIKTIGVADINADNFIYALDTGIILCRLSKTIQKKAQECFEQGMLKDPLPNYKLHCDETASSGTWYARDNAANFLRWCRAFGMTDETLFDSEDLVTHHHERQVIYCLMELARMSTRYGLEPPSLISMEKEIDDGELTPTSVPPEGISLDEGREDSLTTLCKDSSYAMEPLERAPTPVKKSQESILDLEVYRICLKCQCEGFVDKISEGVFKVYGRRVFIRLLKGKHLMVRVGGGWDTFENYLVHHDPVEVFRFNSVIQSGPSQNSTSAESNSSKFEKKKEYLVIRSKYIASNFNSGHESS